MDNNFFIFCAVPPSEEKGECFPTYVVKIRDSLMGRVFVDCPNFNSSRACKKMKNVIDNCIKEKLVVGLYNYLVW